MTTNEIVFEFLVDLVGSEEAARAILRRKQR